MNTPYSDQELIDNWQRVRQQLKAAGIHNHTPTTLVAVSKKKPASMIKTLWQAGQRDFGENYLQEALHKIQQFDQDASDDTDAKTKIVWHYIGSIQRNKTRDIAEHFSWVHTVDRTIIADRLDKQRPLADPNLNVLIQVNIDDEDSKSGCHVNDVDHLVTHIKSLTRLTLRGLMIIPAKSSNSDAFVRTKTLFDRIQQKHDDLNSWDTLSMGMTADIDAAVAAGSTMVRVGSAIFGERS